MYVDPFMSGYGIVASNSSVGSDNSHESFYPWDFIEYYLQEDQTKSEEIQ